MSNTLSEEIDQKTFAAETQSNILAPKLRFKEFDGSWSLEKLGKVFLIFNGYAFSSSDAKEHGCRWVKIADVGINEILEVFV